jgi:outer membrane receptor protein involved in Fe transport
MRYSEKREAVTLFAMDTFAPELLEPEPAALASGASAAAAAAGGSAEGAVSAIHAATPLYDAPRRPQQFSSSEGCAEDASLVLLEQLQRLARQSLLLGVSPDRFVPLIRAPVL